MGAWDAYNVTEDADLGLRLARFGYLVDVASSATWEEAPPGFRDWKYQRMRWQKGWLQTAIVHTRQPARVWRELGPWRCMALYLTLTGMLLSALVHPIYLAALGLMLWLSSGVSAIWWAGLCIFGLGYATSLAIAVIAAWRCGQRGLVHHALLIPVYWLLISIAAYGALWEYAVRPFHWNKTPHSGRAPADAAG